MPRVQHIADTTLENGRRVSTIYVRGGVLGKGTWPYESAIFGDGLRHDSSPPELLNKDQLGPDRRAPAIYRTRAEALAGHAKLVKNLSRP